MEMSIDAEWREPIRIQFNWLEGGTGVKLATQLEVAVEGDDKDRHLGVYVGGNKVAECEARATKFCGVKLSEPITNKEVWRTATQADIDKARQEIGDYPLVRTGLYRSIKLVAVTNDNRYPFKLLAEDGTIIDQTSAEILA